MRQVCDEGFVGIIMGCQQLTSLTVNADVGDDSLKYVGNFCPFIERLEINNAQANIINDCTIFESLCQLEHLRYFTLYYCNITDEAIECLFDYCKDLELISITYSARLSEESLKVKCIKAQLQMQLLTVSLSLYRLSLHEQHLTKFAREKPWEKVIAVMPRSLSRYRHVAAPLPRNLRLSFFK